jgi:hypothetical protein
MSCPEIIRPIKSLVHSPKQMAVQLIFPGDRIAAIKILLQEDDGDAEYPYG